ncbi:uncharacterized protein HMPREF1541_03258 [Cyphellophora europaea CBS 101466]|uniref:Mannan endo-1,6-alpha-mannosidase n=1 Tax=Cyphellophora europaea (strain CBS 101466) TaxID=1220924 RepID=W2RZV1_CYPE1|nr:uncharacterized protein HMPREF1541_03258 [Cyphellophora europaea CBS 101466]ETN41323.1 hypothetical protein HMPREF1541_03258 [Cyphellophora europaea CBS 101466]
MALSSALTSPLHYSTTILPNGQTWLDSSVSNNTAAFLANTQSAIDIYMASGLSNGMIDGIEYWQAANGYTAMVLHDAWSGSTANHGTLLDNLTVVMSSTGHDDAHDGGSARTRGFINEFNDDSLWWGLAALETWELLPDKVMAEPLVAAARHVWDHVSNFTLPKGTKAADGTDMSGGVIWTARAGEGAVNSITSGLFAELGARLAVHEQQFSEKRERYMQESQEALGWILRTRYNEAEKLVMDTIDYKTGETHDWTFTYNTGQTIAAAVALYKALQQTEPRPSSNSNENNTRAHPRAFTIPFFRTRDRQLSSSLTNPSPSNPPTAAQYLRTALDMALPSLTRTSSPRWIDAATGILTELDAYPGNPPLNATQNNDAVGFKSVLLRSLVKLCRALREGDDLESARGGGGGGSGDVDRDAAQVKLKEFVQRQFMGVMTLNRDFRRSSSRKDDDDDDGDNDEGGVDKEEDPPLRFGPWWAGPWDTPTSHSQMAALDVVAALWGVTERGPVDYIV